MESMGMEKPGALDGLRVVDLTDERGLLCGQILADLGADVILVEPPEGSRARRCGPFLGESRDPEESLLWWAYARNRRGIVVDGESDEGRRTLRELARSADFWIESTAPGETDPRRLDPDELARLNPALVVVSITPFGLSGPKAEWPACDVTLQAAAGPLVLQGDRDRPPVRVTWPQAFLHAGADAAVGALIAHFERARSGRGQHVDVSAHQSATASTLGGILTASVGAKPGSRTAGGARMGPVDIRYTYPARDGHVSITHTFGAAMGPATARLMEWLHEHGECDEALRDTDWVRYGARLLKGEVTPEEFDSVKDVVATGTSHYTKGELLEAALERKLLLAPSATMRNLIESDHFASRDFVQRTAHPRTGRRVCVPGPFARLEETPIAYRRSAPTLGQHTVEVLAELRRAASAAAASDRAVVSESAHPLADVKVLDFTWAIAGPSTGRIFADYGATVVRLEAQARPDPSRTAGPMLKGRSGPESSVLFHTMNAGKVMLGLDLGNPASRQVVLDLVRWADVVMETFAPGVMERLGYGYEALRKENAGLVMLSSSLMGQTGPLSSFAGYGNLGAALSGLLDLTGWPDRAPAGPFSAYTDCISPRFTAAAVLAALDHRRRTGQGQYIDFSQVEASTHFVAPLIAEASQGERVPSRIGNGDRDVAPHGVYPVAGDDRWIAIAAGDDDQWRSLTELLGVPGIAGDARFETLPRRREEREALDRLIALHTAGWDGAELEAKLIARGVAAHRVLNSADLATDVQLLHRRHFVEVAHPTAERSVVEASRFALSRTPARRPEVAPTLGADNQRVLAEILGYDEERISEVVISGALN
jgi:crotonobetainyl-CoA:carnitine CoA-transferase CaiB-like acyl-CoA transferase